MKQGKRLGRSSTLLLSICLLWTAASVSAQEETGNIHGIVTDTAGETLPGASIELSGMGAPRFQTADSNGNFRFLGLDPGMYALRASLNGFSTIERPNVNIRVSQNTRIDLQLVPAIEEVISVTSESPLLDERKLAAGTTVSQVELESIPTARDPWAILNQSSGVVVWDVNVGGSSSGTQSWFRGVGATEQENDYIMDGVQITNVSTFELGDSSTYYDFGQFEEIQITTGGNDITKHTGGAAINMVTKRGTNEFRGSARFLLTDGSGYFGFLEQADPGFDENDLGPGQEDFVPNQVDRIQEYGFEAGGPAWHDRVWLWGSWAQNDLTIVGGSGRADPTKLDNVAMKINAQFSQGNSLVGAYNMGDKRVLGRGTGPSTDASATYNQRGPTGITKVEDSHVFGSSFFLSGQYSFIDGGWSLSAVGGCGPDQPAVPSPGGETNTDASGYKTNAVCMTNGMPAEEWKVDASYFLDSGALNHELRFGGRIREAAQEEAWTYPGRNLWHYDGAVAGVQDPGLLAWLGLPPERASDAHMVYAYRQGPVPLVADYSSLWVQDTMTRGPWTFNVGLRYDVQDGENRAGTVDANLGFPEVMPALNFEGNDADGIRWSSLSPRLGITFALGEERRTLLRGSFSQYPRPLGLDQVSRVNPVSGGWAWIVFIDNPSGYQAFYDEGEEYSVGGGFYGFDPANPTSLSTSNKNDPNMDPELTRELILGVEHSLLPELVTGLKLTWRRVVEKQETQELFRSNATGEVTTIPASEYIADRVVSGLLPDGSPYEVQVWAANPAEWSYTGGTLLTDGSREIEYLGASLSMTKRLSNQWMMRAFVNYNFDEFWDVPTSYFENNDPNRLLQGHVDGQIFASGGVLQSDWQWNMNGMYQVAPDRPWGFNLAGNLNGRQGAPIGYTRSVAGLDGISRTISVEENLGDYRFDNIATVDVRLEKEFAATGNVGLTFSIDGFNILNSGTVLNRYWNLGAGNANWVIESISPRIWRLGVRLSWR